MCGTHDHGGHLEGHEQGHCGHCNHDDLSLDELRERRDRLDRDIAAREALVDADAPRTMRTHQAE